MISGPTVNATLAACMVQPRRTDGDERIHGEGHPAAQVEVPLLLAGVAGPGVVVQARSKRLWVELMRRVRCPAPQPAASHSVCLHGQG